MFSVIALVLSRGNIGLKGGLTETNYLMPFSCGLPIC